MTDSLRPLISSFALISRPYPSTLRITNLDSCQRIELGQVGQILPSERQPLLALHFRSGKDAAFDCRDAALAIKVEIIPGTVGCRNGFAHARAIEEERVSFL